MNQKRWKGHIRENASAFLIRGWQIPKSSFNISLLRGNVSKDLVKYWQTTYEDGTVFSGRCSDVLGVPGRYVLVNL